MPYLGYGTRERLLVCGRVLEDEGFTPAADADSRWRNLVRFWKRLESDEVRMRAAARASSAARPRASPTAKATSGLRSPRAAGSVPGLAVDLELMDPPGAAPAVARSWSLRSARASA